MKNKKSKLLNLISLISLAGILIILASFKLTDSHGVKGYADSMQPHALLSSTNHYREEAGLKPLQSDELLSQAAQNKAEHMSNNSYWSHEAPDGTTPWYFIDQTGLDYFKAGENLAYGFKNAEFTVKAWIASEGHRKNILDSEYDIVGFGYANSENFKGGPTTLVVAMYADTDKVFDESSDIAGSGTSTNPPTTNNTESKISLISALLNGNTDMTTNILAILATLVFINYAYTHYRYLYQYVVKGEKILHQHPLIEASLVYLGLIVLMTTTTGVIL